MSNMSYCRFRNTLSDLKDCEAAITDHITDEDENRARRRLILTCLDILDSVGVDNLPNDQEVRAKIDELESEAKDAADYARENETAE